MFDSFGDGWGSIAWHWIDPSGGDTTGTLQSGSSGTAELCITSGGGCHVFYVGTGMFESEVRARTHARTVQTNADKGKI